MPGLVTQHNLIRPFHLIEEGIIHHEDVALFAPEPGAAQEVGKGRVRAVLPDHMLVGCTLHGQLTLIGMIVFLRGAGPP
jgi:hypothetical protein